MGCSHNSASAPGGGGGGVYPYAHGFRRYGTQSLHDLKLTYYIACSVLTGFLGIAHHADWLSVLADPKPSLYCHEQTQGRRWY